MRIAYICADPGVPIFGRKGNSVHVQEVVRALLTAGAQVELFSARTGGDPPSGLEDVRVHALPPLPRSRPADRERAALLANGALYAFLDSEGPFDVVYERYSLWSFAGMEYARNQRIPRLLEVNAPLIEEQSEHRELIGRDLAGWVARKAFGAASALLAVSREGADYLNTFAEARGRVHVVPNGVNPHRFGSHLLPSCPAPTGVFTVGFVGTLKPWHGLPVLVDAFSMLHSKHSDIRLLIVGDGPEREPVEAALQDREALTAAHFTGSVDPNQIPGYLASMDVAVAPYAESEHFYFSPLKVYEYMAAGLPVVASSVGQLAELIEHRVNGLLVPPGDRAALAAELLGLKQHPAIRASLGRAARETILRGHTWDSVATRILEIAERVADQSRLARGA
jgi:glycosyltransferase involved in cell wall biosynthesis